MSKRKLDQYKCDFVELNSAKKHSLDSDEEDNVDEDNHLNEDDIEGEEGGVAITVGYQRVTAFNMQEELEEGHFDKAGYFIWHNESEVRDSWLDNINWQAVDSSSTKYNLDPTEKGLADDSESETEIQEHFDEIEVYKGILEYMQPNENINKAIRRLGGDNRNLSSVERLKRKKAGTLTTNEGVIKLTELANKILYEKGDMNIYQETYESIAKKIADGVKKGKDVYIEPELDMYADDFGEKEREKIVASSSSTSLGYADGFNMKEVMWEFKWAQETDKIEGPFATSQMLKWTNEGYFKSGAWVRRHGENTPFYNSNRIDFDLYL